MGLIVLCWGGWSGMELGVQHSHASSPGWTVGNNSFTRLLQLVTTHSHPLADITEAEAMLIAAKFVVKDKEISMDLDGKPLIDYNTFLKDVITFFGGDTTM